MNFNSEVYNRLVDCKNWSDLEATGYTPHLDPTYSAYMKHIYDKNQQQESKIQELTQEIFRLKKLHFDKVAYEKKLKDAGQKLFIMLPYEVKEMNKNDLFKYITREEINGDLFKLIDSDGSVAEEVFEILAPNDNKIAAAVDEKLVVYSKIQAKAFDILKVKAEQGNRDSITSLAFYYLQLYNFGQERYIQYMKSEGKDLSELQSKIDPQKLLDQANELIDSLYQTFDEGAFRQKFDVTFNKFRSKLGTTEEEINKKTEYLISAKVCEDLFFDMVEQREIIRIHQDIFDIIALNEKVVKIVNSHHKSFIILGTKLNAFETLKKKAEEGDEDSKLALTAYYLDCYEIGCQRYIQYVISKGEKIFKGKDVSEYQSPIDPQKLLDLANKVLESIP